MTDQPMDPVRITELEAALAAGEVTGKWGARKAIEDLLASERYHARRSMLRRQAEAVCERRTAEREDARHGMMIARAERDAAKLEVKRLLAKVSELEATLAATLGSWAAYAQSVPGNAEWLVWSEGGMVGPVPGAGTPEDSEPGGEP